MIDCSKCGKRKHCHIKEFQVQECEDFTEEGAVSMIKDSGNRREFETGAVRDIQEGKGRCDLMPLDIVASCMYTHERGDKVLMAISKFIEENDTGYLRYCLDVFTNLQKVHKTTIFLEVSKHFEEGAKKYGENNWQKGIPTHCYIDSAVRHYLKYLRGDTDEPHDRAFVWNIICCIWTCIHKPKLNDYAKKEDAYPYEVNAVFIPIVLMDN